MPVKCPRCGEEGYLEEMVVGGNVYVYARHIYWERNREGRKVKRHVKKCYLGPKEHYIYVDGKFHKLGLSSPVTMDLNDYLQAIERLLATINAKIGEDKGLLKQIITTLEKWLETFEKRYETLDIIEKVPE
jgi:hypothetical protein